LDTEHEHAILRATTRAIHAFLNSKNLLAIKSGEVKNDKRHDPSQAHLRHGIDGEKIGGEMTSIFSFV
jgi:hypothetical protein